MMIMNDFSLTEYFMSKDPFSLIARWAGH